MKAIELISDNDLNSYENLGLTKVEVVDIKNMLTEIVNATEVERLAFVNDMKIHLDSLKELNNLSNYNTNSIINKLSGNNTNITPNSLILQELKKFHSTNSSPYSPILKELEYLKTK